MAREYAAIARPAIDKVDREVPGVQRAIAPESGPEARADEPEIASPTGVRSMDRQLLAWLKARKARLDSARANGTLETLLKMERAEEGIRAEQSRKAERAEKAVQATKLRDELDEIERLPTRTGYDRAVVAARRRAVMLRLEGAR